MSSQYPFSPVLSGFSISRGLGQQGIGTRLAPLVRVPDLKFEYPEFEDFKGTQTIDTKRAPGGKVKVVDNDRYEMQADIITDHSVDVKSPIEFSAGAVAAQLNEFERAAMKANYIIREAHERDVRNLLWADNLAGFQGIYGSAATRVLNLTGTARWTSTAPTMRKNVLDLSANISDNTGYKPNTLVLTNELYIAISSADNEIRDVIKNTQFGVPDFSVLARYFEVSQVIVPGIAYNTANPGLEPTYAKLWNGIHALLAYVDPNPARESQNLASTFVGDAGMDSKLGPFLGIQPYYSMDYKSDMLRCNAYYKEKLINAKCGAVIFNANS